MKAGIRLKVTQRRVRKTEEMKKGELKVETKYIPQALLSFPPHAVNCCSLEIADWLSWKNRFPPSQQQASQTMTWTSCKTFQNKPQNVNAFFKINPSRLEWRNKPPENTVMKTHYFLCFPGYSSCKVRLQAAPLLRHICEIESCLFEDLIRFRVRLIHEPDIDL